MNNNKFLFLKKMINRNQNKNFNIEREQNDRNIIPQNKQMNQISKTSNNTQKKKFTQNSNFNRRNIANNNQNQNSNIINNNENDELGIALLIIRRELKKKDDKIIQLEKKVKELTNKLNLLTNGKLNNYNIQSNFNPFIKQSKEEYNQEEDFQIGNYIRPGGQSMGITGLNSLGKNKIRNNNYIRSVSLNNPNYNSDNENVVKRYHGYDNLSHSNDNSVLTYNGVQTNSKRDVKNYLREVKTKIAPKKFKEFIRNIKLLTAKNNTALNKDIIVESVRILFGEEHKDLFIRFQAIIGAGK